MSARLGDRGSVTAEFAIALPAAVLVLGLGAAILAACGHQVRLQDATADAARLAGRGETGRGTALVADVGGTASISREDDLVCVTASAPAGVPLVGIVLRARACALDEAALDEAALDAAAQDGAALDEATRREAAPDRGAGSAGAGAPSDG